MWFESPFTIKWSGGHFYIFEIEKVDEELLINRGMAEIAAGMFHIYFEIYKVEEL